MAVTVTKKYVAADGKEFTDYQKAQAYDRAQAVVRRKKKSQELRLNKLRTILCGPNATQNVGLLCLDIINNPELARNLRDTLNSVLDMQRHLSKA